MRPRHARNQRGLIGREFLTRCSRVRLCCTLSSNRCDEKEERPQRNQRPLSVQYNVEFIVFVELWRFDVPFAPPNLLISLESLGSNPTLSAIPLVI